MGRNQWNKRYLYFGFNENQFIDHLRYKIWNVRRFFYLVRGQGGQALLESLISFGVFFLFVFGIFYFSLLYHTQLWLHHISYENAVCLYYETKQAYKCLAQAKKFIVRALPYLKQVKVSFRSGLNYKESIIQASFPLYIQMIARQSFYAKY